MIPYLFLKVALLSPAVHLAVAGGYANNEEAPPSTAGLWIGLGMLAFAILAVTAVSRVRRRHRLRALSVLPDDPFAVEAMQACVSLFSGLDSAWSARDPHQLGEVASGRLLARWRAALSEAGPEEPVVDGPVSFAYVGAADPPPGADRAAAVRVHGRLRAPTKQVALSRGQRNGLLGLAAAILLASFVGIALAPATKIRSSGPTTIVVRGGTPRGGTHLLTYRKGALIDLTVRSDVADEVHFHGYDIHEDVAPGKPVHFRIRATIEGAYPVELEQHGVTLAQVSVQP